MQCHPHQGTIEVQCPCSCFSSPVSCCFSQPSLPFASKRVLNFPIQVRQPDSFCSVSDPESSSQSSSSDVDLSNGHTAVDIEWDTLGFGTDHLAPVRACHMLRSPCILLKRPAGRVNAERDRQYTMSEMISIWAPNHFRTCMVQTTWTGDRQCRAVLPQISLIFTLFHPDHVPGDLHARAGLVRRP